MSAFFVENPHDGKTFENFTRFEWGVEVGVVTTFMLRLFVAHEFDMNNCSQITAVKIICFKRHKKKIGEFNQEHVGRNSAAFANKIGVCRLKYKGIEVSEQY